jgi:hypothetical protein
MNSHKERKEGVPRKVVPQGPNESSPVRSAGFAVQKSEPSRPVRHSQDAAFALRATARPQFEGRAKAKRRRDEGGTGRSTAVTFVSRMRETSSQPFYRPWRDGHLFLHHFPVRRGGCWATFIGPLRYQRAIIAPISLFLPGFLQG